MILGEVEVRKELEKRVAVAASLSLQMSDCWRPLIHSANISLDRRSCNRPLCTLADVYSCSNPDCVQLNDPAEQLILRFAGDSAWIVCGLRMDCVWIGDRFCNDTLTPCWDH